MDHFISYVNFAQIKIKKLDDYSDGACLISKRAKFACNMTLSIFKGQNVVYALGLQVHSNFLITLYIQYIYCWSKSIFPAESSMKKSEQFNKNLFNHCLKTTTVCFILRIVRWLLEN